MYARYSILLPLLLAAVPADASRFGRDGFSGNPANNNGATCSACHTPGAAVPNVTLSGPTTVDAGGTYEYTVVIEGGPAQTGGVNLSVSDGISTLMPANSALQAVGQELTHARPAPFGAGNLSFSFRWTAPVYDTTVAFYAAGNSSDGQLDLLGDGIATDTLAVTVQNGTGSPSPPPPAPLTAGVTLSVVAGGLNRPVAVTHAGDARLFVAEQAGRIRIVQADGTVLATPFLDIRAAVDDSGGEQGLLGLAFHPDYPSNGYFYVNYTYDPGPGNDRTRISRFRRGSDPNLANPGSELILMEYEQPFANHNGGDLHFGPDGYLYIASGDGGGGGDPNNFAQNPSVPLGKLLRIDVDATRGSPDCDVSGGAHYGIPPGNTFNDGPGGQGCDEIWALGLRNPWRFSFDRQTGDIWIADVGQNAFEEINFVSAGTPSGLNFGWRCYEGDSAFNTGGCQGGYLFPVHVTAHANGNCSITGGFVYRGPSYPSLAGRYFFTDFCNSSIRTLSGSPFNPTVDVVVPAGEIANPVTFGENAAGELYVASLDGTLYRIQGTGQSPVVIGETGIVAMNQTDASEWHTIGFQNSYTDPVVIMGPPSFNGGHPMTIRARNITATGFEFQLDEWQYLDQSHTTETIGYLVLESGEYVLADGTRLVAGSVTLDHNWLQVDFTQAFDALPVLLVQSSSYNGSWAVTERLRNISTSGFEVRLQEEEAADGTHALEQLGWIAIATGAGASHEAIRLETAVDHTADTFAFTGTYGSTPVILASIQTFLGNNTVALRLDAVDRTSLTLHVEEEQSADEETAHLNETVGYAAFPAGSILGQPQP